MEFEFTQGLGWSRLHDLEGDFSVTPDTHSFKRVFSADVKVLNKGRKLLGVLGIYFDHADNPWKGELGLFAYMTNFPLYYQTPTIINEESLSEWVNLIADGVTSLPSSPSALIKSVKRGRIGTFEAEPFLASTPWGNDFIDWLKTVV